MQSPLDIKVNAGCGEHHQGRPLKGEFRVTGNNVKKQILSNKLCLVYDRRPCGDPDNVTCSEPDSPGADFPHGFPGFADAIHIDIKIKSEHMIKAKQYDAEFQIFHIHPKRRWVPTQVAMIEARQGGYNYYFEEAITAFQQQYDMDLAQCAAKKRRERELVTEFDRVLGKNVSSTIHHYESWADYSTELERPDFADYAAELERRLAFGIWDPYHPMLVPTIYFYRYDGSLTDPPCGEFVSWFICDEPMVISLEQLEQMKRILFTHVDPNCNPTSVQCSPRRKCCTTCPTSQ